MNISYRLTWILFFVAALLTAPRVQAQADSTLYVTVECMHSTSSDYVDIERNIWKPMHQEWVDQGRKVFWGLYGVMFGSRDECDYYTVNAFRGVDALDSAFSDVPETFAKVLPDLDFDEAMTKTGASRKIVRQQLYTLVDGIPPKDFSYVYVNLMNAPDGSAYVDLERRIFKPMHEAFVADGLTKGWFLYSLVSPHGASVGYNFVTADFVDSLAEIPWGEYFSKVHPTASLDEAMQETNATRTMVLSELWNLIDSTEHPSE